MKQFFITLSRFLNFIYRACDRALMYIQIHRFNKIGKNVKFFPLSSDFIFENIEIGNDDQINQRASFLSYIAKIHIGNKVLFGPNVTIRGGNHPNKAVEMGLKAYKTIESVYSAEKHYSTLIKIFQKVLK